MCVKCNLKPDRQTDKVLRCYGGCSNVIHYVCSANKPTELKIFETHSTNIKWCCDKCGADTKETSISELCIF